MRNKLIEAARRAVQTHYGKHRVSVSETRAEVLNCARKAAKGSACDMAERLTASLEVATQHDIAALGKLAEAWDYRAASAYSAPEWSGSPDPSDPDNFWIDDDTGERVNAHTGERTRAPEAS